MVGSLTSKLPSINGDNDNEFPNDNGGIYVKSNPYTVALLEMINSLADFGALS